MNRLYQRRLRSWEPFDEITMRVVPRYKTSGLSGDEWRQHVQVEFKHKGEVVHSFGASTVEAALMLVGHHYLQATCPIPERVIEIERERCDQPSCQEKPVGRYLLKRLAADDGQWLADDESGFAYYRKFCRNHARRGDCGREDSDRNYEPLDGLKPEDSSNLIESPSVFGGAYTFNDPDPEVQS